MTYTWQGASEAEQLLARLEQPNFEPLMETWARVLVEDNRAGVLSGTDRHDRPMAPVSPEWRPTCNPVPTPPRMGNDMGVQSGAPKLGTGFGPNVFSDPNLPSSVYWRLTGGPLAPRGLQSRTVANYVVTPGRTGSRWFVRGIWEDVRSRKGFLFLPSLFATRDLAGLRRWGQQMIETTLTNYLKQLLGLPT